VNIIQYTGYSLQYTVYGLIIKKKNEERTRRACPSTPNGENGGLKKMESFFEKLEVWKKSCRLCVELYKELKDCRDFGLKDQILRAAVSIPSNIAEGAERKSNADYKRFISIANGSAAELRTQLYIASEVEIIKNERAKEFINNLKCISKMLQALYHSLVNEVKK
jgi:four helix bundle protein